jgi:GT2 family glycosyltransferase
MATPTSAPPQVSVLIVSWNTRDLLRECLASVAAKTSVPHEVIVVDNASADGSADMVRREHPEVRLVASETNLGFVKGNNAAARLATGENLLLLNPDTRLETDAVAGLDRALRSDASIGAAGCKILNADGSVQRTCAGSFPTPWNEFTSLLFLHRLAPRLFPDRERSGWDHLDDRDVDCLSGACMIVRRGLWEELGGFDERIFMYAEDVDLCRRVLGKRLRVRYVASESVWHFEGSSAAQRKESFYSLVAQMAGNEYVLRKHDGAARAFAYRAAVLAGASVRLLVGAILYPLLPAPAGRDRGWFLRKSRALFGWAVGTRTPASAP